MISQPIKTITIEITEPIRRPIDLELLARLVNLWLSKKGKDNDKPI